MNGIKHHLGKKYIEETFEEMLKLVFPHAIIALGKNMFTVEVMGLRHNDGSKIVFHVPIPYMLFIENGCTYGDNSCVRMVLYKIALGQRRIADEYLGNLAFGTIREVKI